MRYCAIWQKANEGLSLFPIHINKKPISLTMDNIFDNPTPPPPNSENPLPPPPPTQFRGNVGTLLAAFFKNPGGGAAEVIVDDSTKVSGGFLMMFIGMITFIIAFLSTGAGGRGSEQFIYLFEFFIFFAIFNLGFNFIGNALGKTKSPQDAILGAGASSMFFGIAYFLIMIVSLLFSNSIMMSRYSGGGPSVFVICLLIGFIFGFLFMLGSVTYGIWLNRFNTSGTVAGWFSALSVSMALAFGTWLFIQINIGDFGRLGRFFF
jgi:hypothetical protein